MPVDLSRANLRVRREMHSVPKSAKSLKCVEERIVAWSNKCAPEAKSKYRLGKFCLPNSQAAEKIPGGEKKDEEEEDEENSSTGPPIEPFSDVLLTLRVMVPMKYNPENIRAKLKMDREVVVLGKNLLSEFRDMISCSCDTAGPFVDVSRDPCADVRAADRYADKTNSGFLFIGDTFYGDMRIEGNADHAQQIIAWAKQQPEIKELRRGRMEETRFMDLEGIRVGFPYVYQHFGACEHIFLISDMRVISPGDNRIGADYPYLQLLNQLRNILCDVCGVFEASHQVSGSSQHIFDPVRLCGRCLSSYHYADGNKLGEFAVYRFRK